MQVSKKYLIGALLLAASCSAAFADEPDHARWFAEDMTPQARYQTLKKEAYAGQRESLMQCRSMGRGERSDCVREANQNFRTDMANARSVLNR